MRKFIETLCAVSLPLAFMTAGGGMLWLYRVRAAEGDFYARLNTHAQDWVGSHILLLASAILMIPAAVALARAVGNGRGSLLAGIGLLAAVPGSVFQAGQYAIDFVMPIISDVGGAAHTVHERLFTTEPLHTFFYELPNLGSLGLLLMTFGLIRSHRTGRVESILLPSVWAVVIIGGAIHPLVQRVALTLLGLAYVPTARRLLQRD